MKTILSVLFSMCMAMAFAVAGTIVDADPIIVGSIGLLVSQIPVYTNGLAITLGLNSLEPGSSATSKELRGKYDELIRALEPLANKKLSEFTDEERNLWLAKMPELDRVSSDLRIALQQEEVLKSRARSGNGISLKDQEDMQRYSFRKVILAQLGQGKLDGIELEMHQEALKEASEDKRIIRGIGVPYLLLSKRAMKRSSTGQNVTTAADGGYLVQDEPLLYYDALRDKVLLPGLSAKFLTGLVGDLPLIEGGSFTASWLAEDGTDTAAKAAFDEFLMQPKRLQATGALSLQLLRQTSVDVERMIENDLIAAHALGLQAAAINGSGNAPEPRGILNKVGIGSVAVGANGGAMTFAHAVNLETEVAIDNADGPSMAYLTNAKVRGLLKQTEKTNANALYIWDKNEVNGYPAYVTNAVPSNLTKGNQSEICSAMIFGDWSKLHIGQWGNIDIIADPYSLKKKAEVEVTVISYGDIGIIQPEAFAACKDIKTS
jgi:HK97 family phage major capsid protein